MAQAFATTLILRQKRWLRVGSTVFAKGQSAGGMSQCIRSTRSIGRKSAVFAHNPVRTFVRKIAPNTKSLEPATSLMKLKFEKPSNCFKFDLSCSFNNHSYVSRGLHNYSINHGKESLNKNKHANIFGARDFFTRTTNYEDADPDAKLVVSDSPICPSIGSEEELNNHMNLVTQAQSDFGTFTQSQVDKIFRAVALAADSHRLDLAKIAVEETGMGIVEDKVIKNNFASEFVYHKYKDAKTCGVIEDDAYGGIKKIAEPVGIICGVIPVTNPTSTIIFKTLLALKTRNCVVFAPHPRASKCSAATIEVLSRAAVQAGAPPLVLSCLRNASVQTTQLLMSHKNTNLILATGGPGMVKASYTSGKPAIGVGAGNVPAVIDETADWKFAVNSILMSKAFDNGVICCSEQSVVVVDEIYDKVREEFIKEGSHILTKEEKPLVGDKIINDKGEVNSDIVGQSAVKIASLSGISVPKDTRVLIAEADTVGPGEKFSYEKLSPVLALYRASDWKDAVHRALELVNNGGVGHTSCMYTNPNRTERIDYFDSLLPTGRILVDMPSAMGGIGDIYNFKLQPSLTLGCGTWAGNAVSESVGIEHLMNVKTVAEKRENMQWLKLPGSIYFKRGILEEALKDISGLKRAFIVSDSVMVECGYVKQLSTILKNMNLEIEVYDEILPDPTFSNVLDAVKVMDSFKPDCLIAIGGGSPIDAAKICRLVYENPDLQIRQLFTRFLDIRKKIVEFPKLGKLVKTFVAIPTTSGTGSEVTPFSVITEDHTHRKFPIADYTLTPDIAILDPQFAVTQPKQLTANAGMDALTHAVESYISTCATDYTQGFSIRACRMLFRYLPRAVEDGTDMKAREKVHNASCLAGLAFSNAFLGVNHSLAHALGSKFGLPHGLANAVMLPYSLAYNATEKPFKKSAWSQYEKYRVIEDLAWVSDYLQLSGSEKTDYGKCLKFIEAVQNLNKKCGIPSSIKETGVKRETFEEELNEMAEMAFDDQCTGTNPRFPLISELKDLYLQAYDGKPIQTHL